MVVGHYFTMETDVEVLKINKQDAVWFLQLNRPSKHNALDTTLTSALLNTLNEIKTTQACKAVVLYGAGPSFCAGADTSEFKGFAADKSKANVRADLTTNLHRVFSSLPQPIIAAVHGYALGGGAGLALACDCVVIEKSAKFGYPELKHGISPAIVMSNLVRQLGRKQAFELVSTGRILSGDELLAWGGANSSVSGIEDTLMLATEMASKWASYSSSAMSVTKRLFYRCADLPLQQGLDCGHDTNIIMRSFANN